MIRTSINVALANLAKRGAEIKNLGPMCHDCAFRLGTEPNNCENTMSIIEDRLMCDGDFNCHITDAPDHSLPCTGFLYARQYFENLKEPGDSA